MPRQRRHKPIQIVCTGCGIQFERVPSKIYRLKHDRFYCNNECYKKYGINNKERKKSKLLTHYHCGSCEKFIRHEDALMRFMTKDGKELKYPYPICPDPDCKPVKLNTTPRLSKSRQVLREQKKELKIQQYVY